MEQKALFKINLNEIEGEGTFKCPSCKTIISPDDESGIIYDIIDLSTREDGSLKVLIIQCKKCQSVINLEGFEALDNKV